MTRRRRVTIAVAAGIGLVLAVIVAGLPVYVFPPQGDIPADADLIYVIGPPRAPRVEVADRLRTDGVADDVFVSVAADADPRRGYITASELSLCDQARVTCETPEPFTTAGEARMLDGYARDHAVDDAVVLTYTPHVARTRYIFAKCSDTDVTVIGVDEHLDLGEWAYEYLYQTAAFVKAWIQPCPGR